MQKQTLLEASKAFRNVPPNVKAAVERLTPTLLSEDDADDIEGDWLIAEVQMAKILPADRDRALSKAHEMIRKLLADRAARIKK